MSRTSFEHTKAARLARITRVIDDVSFQTNILAMNAALAGAQRKNGRSFVVAADEVRSLAQYCAQAAKEMSTRLGARPRLTNRVLPSR